MFDRGLRWFARRGAIMAAIVLVGVPVAEGGDPGSGVCPPNLEAWRTSGNAEVGGEWVAEILEIRGDIGVLREVLIRFGDGALPREEARWFEAPSALVPETLQTRTLSFVGDELLPFCRHLAGTAMDALREQSRPKCFVSDSGARMIVRGKLTVTDTEDGEPDRPTDGAIGVSVGGEAFDEGDLECERLEELTASFDPQESSGPGTFGPIYDMLEEMTGTDGAVEMGLAAVPPARHVLGVLRERDTDRIPENLPSEFYLTVAAASGPYAEALALERMLTADDTDEEVALKLLGDFATPVSTSLLRLRLRSGVAEKRGRIVSLALRALLAADPDVAQIEAVPLLVSADFVRPALGVFALTDPTVRDDLESLDPADADALREAGARVLAYLETRAPEEELRRTAHELRESE